MKRKITKIRLILEQESGSKQEYISAAGQARFQDGNEKTSIAAARRKAIAALKAKGAKGKIQFHKPKKVGDKYVVVAYVGTPEKGEWDASQGGYSPTGAAAKKGQAILNKVKGKYPDNKYVDDMEDWFGTPGKWHSFLTGAKALDQAPKAQAEFARLNADLKQLADTWQRGKGSATRGGDESGWAKDKWVEVKAQLDKLKVAAGLASKIGYRVTLFSRDKSQRPGEAERDVLKSTRRALKGKTAKLSGKTRKGRGYSLKGCRINKRCKCLVPSLRYKEWRKDRGRGTKAEYSDQWNERIKEIRKMLSAIIPKSEHVPGYERYACTGGMDKMIMKFQKSHGLTCDACIGKKTYALLKTRYEEIVNA